MLGAPVTFATTQGREQLARQLLRDILNAAVVCPAAQDTHQFGMFSGKIARTPTSRTAARVLARVAVKLSGTPHQFASEGSFPLRAAGLVTLANRMARLSQPERSAPAKLRALRQPASLRLRR